MILLPDSFFVPSFSVQLAKVRARRGANHHFGPEAGVQFFLRESPHSTLPQQPGNAALEKHDDDIPGYLKTLQGKGRLENEDNFGPEDVVWTGENGALNPDELIQEMGREHRSLLFQAVRAMIAGHQPGLRQHELEGIARKVGGQITGQPRPGTTDIDDSPLLLEIAHRYHTALHDAGEWPTGTVPLQPIIRDVVSEFGIAHRKDRMSDEGSFVRVLGRKFDKEKDLWLARATTDDPYHTPNRFNDLKLLVEGLRSVAKAGVTLDMDQIRPTKRPSRKTEDRTP